MDDVNAIVSGNVADGWIVKPSSGKTDIVVEIPTGVEPEKVTVEVPSTAKVKPNGAKVKVVNSGHDVSSYINVPAADSTTGVVDFGNATLKADLVFAETTEGDNKKNVDAVLDTAMDDNKGSATIKSAKPGLYYSMEASNDLLFPAGDNTKSGGATMATGITVDIDKPNKPTGNAVFYRIKVSLTAE